MWVARQSTVDADVCFLFLWLKFLWLALRTTSTAPRRRVKGPNWMKKTWKALSRWGEKSICAQLVFHRVCGLLMFVDVCWCLWCLLCTAVSSIVAITFRQRCERLLTSNFCNCSSGSVRLALIAQTTSFFQIMFPVPLQLGQAADHLPWIPHEQVMNHIQDMYKNEAELIRLQDSAAMNKIHWVIMGTYCSLCASTFMFLYLYVNFLLFV